MKRRDLLLAVLAGLIAVVALAAPALAGAAMPNGGWFSGHDDAGGSIDFRVGGRGGPGLVVERTMYNPVDHEEFTQQYDFELAGIHSDGRFGTCAYERVNEVFFREYCLYGQFDAPDHVSGTVKIFIFADRVRFPKALAMIPWSAEHVVPR